MRAGRAVGAVAAGFPARDGAGMDAELARRRGRGGGALVDVSAGARRGGGVSVPSELHQPVVASASAPRAWVLPGLGLRSRRVAQRRDGVTRTLGPMGFRGMRKSTVMPNAQPRPWTATPASIARRRRPHHREFPAGYSLTGCSPAEPASASPAVPGYIHLPVRHNQHCGRHFLPIERHQPLAQPADSLPQPRPIAPIFRDRTRKPGRQEGRDRDFLTASEAPT